MTDPIYRMALILWSHLHVIFIWRHKKRGVLFTQITDRIINFIFACILNKETFLQYQKEETAGGKDFHTSFFPSIKKVVLVIKN